MVRLILSQALKINFHIPKDYSSSEDTDYLHFTSNNTIFGTQFHEFQKVSKTQCWSVTCHQIFSQEKLMFRNLI